LQHADPVEALIAAIPTAARWPLAALPKYLGPDELTQLMSAFDDDNPQHRRDYAIVRCLADLGPRSCEVAALRLNDLDWKTGTVTIPRDEVQEVATGADSHQHGQCLGVISESCRCCVASRWR
jgi:integrase